MQGKLRSYQEKGVEFMFEKLYGLFRMDRGTGKTPTALVDANHQVREHGVQKILYVAPLSTLENVRNESRKFGTVLDPVVIYGEKDKRKKLIEGRGNLHIINFDAVRIMAPELDKAGYDMVVVDESYKIKDSEAQVSIVTKALGRKAKYRRILTGMLFAESIEDAWNQIDFLSRDVFWQGFYPFRNRYCVMEEVEIERVKMVPDPKNPGKKIALMKTVKDQLQVGPAPLIQDPYGSEKMIPDPNWGTKREVVKEKKKFKRVVGVRNLEEFTAKIAPFTYNAEKKVCLPELPDKTYQVLKVRMMEEQAKLYAKVLKTTRSEVQGRVVDHKWALSKIQKLHQIASGFVYDVEKEPLYLPSAKFEELTSILETTLVDHDKAVIFTAFKAEPFLVRNVITQMSRPIEVFVLPENGSERQAEIDRWSKWTNCPAVFIANVASGGVGLNLQAAHTAIFFSNDYKLEGREQAEDRVHRFGSDMHNKINIIDLVTAGTVDEDILEALMSKRSVVEVFMEHLRKETAE